MTINDYFNLPYLKDLVNDPEVRWLDKIHLVEERCIFNHLPYGSAATFITKEDAVKLYGALRASYEVFEEEDCIRYIINVYTPYRLDMFGQDTVRDTKLYCSCGYTLNSFNRCCNSHCSNYFMHYIKERELW